MAQLEKKAAEEAGLEGNYESSEPTSMTNSSTVEGEHTIQHLESEPEELASEEENVQVGKRSEIDDAVGTAGNGLDTSLSSNNVDSSYSSLQEPSDQDSNDGRKNKMGDVSKVKDSNLLLGSGDNSDATTTPATTPGSEDKLIDFNKEFGSFGGTEDIQLLKLRLEEVSV